MISVLIPYKSDNGGPRDVRWNWIRERYRVMLPDAEIVLGINEETPFNRSKAINTAFSKANPHNEYILIADTDTIFQSEWIYESLYMLSQGAAWVIPYGSRGYWNLTPEYSERVLSAPVYTQFRPTDADTVHQLESWSGQVLMSRRAFERVNGFDERFKGWGFEDNCFTIAMNTINGPLQRIDHGFAYHIWHPIAEGTTFDSPTIQYNKDRFALYQWAAEYPPRMFEVVSGNRKWIRDNKT